MDPQDMFGGGQRSGWGTGWEGWSFPNAGRGGFRSQGGGGQTQLLERLISLVTSRLVGRTLTFHTKADDVTLELAELDIPTGNVALSSGQLGEVTAVATDVQWRDVRCERVVAVFHNVHLRSGDEPRVVAAPIDVTGVLTADVLDALVATHAPQLQVEVTADAVPTARWRKHPEWGSVAVDVGVDGARIWVKPRRLQRGDWGTGVVRRIPEFSFRLPLPPERAHIVGIEPRPGGLEVRAQVAEWTIPLPIAGLDEAVRRVGQLGSMFDVSRWAP